MTRQKTRQGVITDSEQAYIYKMYSQLFGFEYELAFPFLPPNFESIPIQT